MKIYIIYLLLLIFIVPIGSTAEKTATENTIIMSVGDAVYINPELIIVYAGKENNYIKLTLIYPKRKNIIPGRYYKISNKEFKINNNEFTIKLATEGLLILIPLKN